MTQHDFTHDMTTFDCPSHNNKNNPGNLAGKEGTRILRSGNGSLQWLVTNTRPDLAADVSLSAGQVTGTTLNDINNLNKIIRKAKRDEALPITI